MKRRETFANVFLHFSSALVMTLISSVNVLLLLQDFFSLAALSESKWQNFSFNDTHEVHRHNVCNDIMWFSPVIHWIIPIKGAFLLFHNKCIYFLYVPYQSIPGGCNTCTNKQITFLPSISAHYPYTSTLPHAGYAFSLTWKHVILYYHIVIFYIRVLDQRPFN